MTFDWTSGHNMLEVDIGILIQKAVTRQQHYYLVLIHDFNLACKDIGMTCTTNK